MQLALTRWRPCVLLLATALAIAVYPPPQHLNLRGSNFVWTDAPPDLRRLPCLANLSLRACAWRDGDGEPWDTELHLPASLQFLDLAGAPFLADLEEIAELTARQLPFRGAPSAVWGPCQNHVGEFSFSLFV